MNEYIQVWKRWKDFSGRSTRKEFWMFVLCHFSVGFITFLLMAIPVLLSGGEGGPLTTSWAYYLYSLTAIFSIYALAVVVPYFAAMTRRLRDAGYNPNFLLLIFVPLIGGLALIYMWCQPSNSDTE